MSESTSGPDLFNLLADEFADRHRRGERPPLTEYTDKYPELADQIRELFPALVAIEQLGAGSDPAAGLFAPQPASQPPIPERLGDYRILREIARGGMGTVYEAVQESLGRHVALKVLPQFRTHDPNLLERFQREARAAAMLHHTNIVPVFGVGEHNGVHHYAMQFIQGQSLDAVLREVKRMRGLTTARAIDLPPSPRTNPGSRPAWRSSWCPGGSRARAGPQADTVSVTGIAAARVPARIRDASTGSGPRPDLLGLVDRGPVGVVLTIGAWPGSACRRPRRSRTPITRRCCTATSSRRTCSWICRGRCGSPTSGWPRPRVPTP